MGARGAAAEWLYRIPTSVRDTLVFFLLIFVFMLLLRRKWLAGALFVVVFLGIELASNSETPGIMVASALIYTLIAVAALRFGILTLGVCLFVFFLIRDLPITADASAWFFPESVFMVAALAALACWAFHVSIGGQRLWNRLLSD